MYMNLIDRNQSTHRHISVTSSLNILEKSTASVLKSFEDFFSLDNCIALDFQKYHFLEVIRFSEDVRVNDSKAICIALSDIHMWPLALYYVDKNLIDVAIPLSSRIDDIKLEIWKKLCGEHWVCQRGSLDECEFYILLCLSKGVSPKEIAQHLNKPVKTIYSKTSRILRKMQLCSFRDLFL